MLKSAELTGKWEKQLREIEAGTYDVSQFMQAMKTMVAGLVHEVKNTRNVNKIIVEEVKKEPVPKTQKKQKASPSLSDTNCPKCGQGKI